MKHPPGFLNLVSGAKRNARKCTIQDVRARLDREEEFFSIDVREDREFAAGRADGARHLGRGIFERDIEYPIPDRDAPIVLYCGGEFRSALAAEILQKMGYCNALSMDGGIPAWREAGFPQERG